MAHEFHRLAVVRDDESACEIHIQRIYQENGGRGIQIVIVADEGLTTFVHQTTDIVLPAGSR